MGIVFFIGKVKVDIQSKVEKNYWDRTFC